MQRLRMRTTLLIALLAVSFGLTAINLLMIRDTIQRQTYDSLASDLQHSLVTFQNLQRQRREMLSRESALLADLPSLKALMTTRDRKTIEDGGFEFWRVSGSDFFALTDESGRLLAHYNRERELSRNVVQRALDESMEARTESQTVVIGDMPYELAIQPLYFGSSTNGSALGYVAIGYAIDQRVAKEVSQAAEAEVAFSTDKAIVVSTLDPATEKELRSSIGQLPEMQGPTRNIHLGRDRYLVAFLRLSPPAAAADSKPVNLIVLKSYARASQLLMRVNRWVLGLGVVALLVAALLAVLISSTVTRPVEQLVAGARALGRGDFDYKLNENGAEEVRELSRAFDRMRIELRRTQQDLLNAERLATIGRMASSISHDLRHYLSAMYANAEFLSHASTSQEEREELMTEVRLAVHGMTDLIESLLIFSQTGSAFHPRYESISFLVERAASMLRSHPDARNVEIVLDELSTVEACVDAQKLGRAVFNLLLNACQAAKRGSGPPRVYLTLSDSKDSIFIRIADNGPGVQPSISKTMFQPFVSEGKESGVGLGLTLAQHIAQEHGGEVKLEESIAGKTVFCIVLPRTALQALETNARREASHAVEK